MSVLGGSLEVNCCGVVLPSIGVPMMSCAVYAHTHSNYLKKEVRFDSSFGFSSSLHHLYHHLLIHMKRRNTGDEGFNIF